MSRIAAVILAGLALVAAAWFAVGVRQTHDSDAATAIVGQAARPSPAELRRARTLIDSAGWLYPGQDVAHLRVLALVDARRYVAATRAAVANLHAEPQNLEALTDLSLVFLRAPAVARTHSGLTIAQVRARIFMVDPIARQQI